MMNPEVYYDAINEEQDLLHAEVEGVIDKIRENPQFKDRKEVRRELEELNIDRHY